MVCTRTFCTRRVGEIPEVCFMHIKRAECGESETTWVCTLCKNSSVMKITDSKDSSEVLAGVCWSEIQDPLGWVCVYK